MKLGTGILLLSMLSVSPEARYFRYERPIQAMPQHSGQTCLALDAGIFAHASPRLADLRLYQNGAETPYAIYMATPATGEEKDIAPLNMGMQAGETVFDAEMPATQYSDLKLNVAAQNFIATVIVSGSRSRTEHAAIQLGTYTIFDLSRQKLGRSTVLHLPDSDLPYLHFRISGPLSPENISGLTVQSLPSRPPRYQTVAESARITQNGHSSVLEFTVPAHVPVDQIVFVPAAGPALFSRNVDIRIVPISPSMKGDGSEPQRAALFSGNILRIHDNRNGHRIDEERLAISVPAMDFATPATWTAVIDNGDDAPLPLKSAQLRMVERDLCFEDRANSSFALFYGDPALATPRYDYAALFAPQASAPAATAEAEQPNPAYRPRPDERPFTEKHPILLWGALVAVIALLGGVAVRTERRITPAR